MCRGLQRAKKGFERDRLYFVVFFLTVNGENSGFVFAICLGYGAWKISLLLYLYLWLFFSLDRANKYTYIY